MVCGVRADGADRVGGDGGSDRALEPAWVADIEHLGSRLDPQITVGLLTDAAGFPLMVEAFEGNKAEGRVKLVV